MQPAGPNLEDVLIAVNPFAAAFRHGPTLITGAIDCHVECAVVIGIGWLGTIGPCIVGREYATYKRNDAKSMLAIVAKPIDVPPKVIARIYRLIELRRAISAATACRPDKAAIGTPGPG